MRRVSWKPLSSVAIVAVLYALVLSFIPLAASAQTATSSLLVKLAVELSPDQQSVSADSANRPRWSASEDQATMPRDRRAEQS